MRIQCPSCMTIYQVNDEAIGSTGRQVRCAKCRTSWHATPLPEPAPVVAATPAAAAPAAAPARAAQATETAAAAPAAEPAPAPQPEPEEDPIAFSEDDDIAAFEQPDSTANDPDGGDQPNEGADLAAAEPDADAETGTAPNQEDDEEEGADEPRETLIGEADQRLAVLREAQARVGISSPGNLSAPVRPTKRKTPQGKARQYAPALIASSMAIVMILAPLLFREAVVRAVPDTAGLYSALGMPVNLRGLDFGKVETFREVEDGTDILVVEGQLINVDQRSRKVPAVRLSLLGEDANELYAWAVEPRTLNLEPGETTRFRARLASPPPAATDVALRFVDRTQRQAGL